MGLKRTDEFRADAVRIALTSGLTRKQVASDLGVGLSTLNKWVTAHRDTEVVSDKDLDLARENERLRRENRILKEERDILKRPQPSSRAKSHEVQVHPLPDSRNAVSMRGEEHRDAFCAKRMCDVLDVSARGLRACRSRPASQRQRTDMVVLAHIKEQSRLSLGSYGRPRMTEELKELGLSVGHRRVGRLMRENGIRVERSKKYKVTTDSNHALNIAPNLLNRDFTANEPNRKWAGDISYVWTREGWLYLAVLLDLHSRRVIGWAVSNRMKRDLAIRALQMAVALRQPPKGCIHHTDRHSHGLQTNHCRAMGQPILLP
jgi:transposase-like protein